VAWTAPAENHLAIVEYEIQIADAAGAYSVDATLCDGSDSTVIANLYCIIPMASLTSSPYSLAVDALITFKVRARNSRDWSAVSPANTAGVLAQTVPATMTAPYALVATTGEDRLAVAWAALTTAAETGGSTVTSYHLQSDSGTTAAGTGVVWTDIVGYSPASLDTTISLTSAVVAGTTYQFRARASNIHGWGAWSSQTAIKAA
jgi:hypothetical protein